MAPIRLMLVDDHEIVRAGLRMMLEAEPDLEIVAEAVDNKRPLPAGTGRSQVLCLTLPSAAWLFRHRSV